MKINELNELTTAEMLEKEKQFKASSTPSPQGMEQNEKTKIQITHDI